MKGADPGPEAPHPLGSGVCQLIEWNLQVRRETLSLILLKPLLPQLALSLFSLEKQQATLALRLRVANSIANPLLFRNLARQRIPEF